MPDRNIILRLQGVVSGSVRNAFAGVNQDVGELQAKFNASKADVAALTREMRKLASEGKDISDIERRLEAARVETRRWRTELQTATARLERLDGASKKLNGIADRMRNLNIATGLFTAGIGFGLNELTQKTLEFEEAINRASLGTEQGYRLIFAAQRAGIRDAEGFIEELKEIPRALSEAGESADRLNAFAQLGLNPDELLGVDPTERFLHIAAAVRAVDRDSRQYLLETAGLTGTLADQLLHVGNLSQSEFEAFANGAREGATVTREQAQAARELQGQIAEFKQELLIGSLAIVQEYLPAIKALIQAVIRGVGATLEFIRENREIVIILGSVAISLLAVSAGYKAVAFAISVYRAAQTALAAASVVSWANPLIAAFSAIGIAIGAAVWLFSLFNKEADKASGVSIPSPDTGRVDQAEAQAQRYADLGRRRANELDFYAGPQPAAQQPIVNVAAQPAAQPPIVNVAQAAQPAAQPPVTPAASQIFNIDISVTATVESAQELATDIGNRLASELQAKLATTDRGR